MSSINWLTAALRGRLGEVVGSSWRGKSYTKIYVKPTDPKTTGQTDVRGIFAHVGHLAHMVYEQVLKPYTYPVPHAHTAYNQMMMINRELYDDLTYDPAKVQILRGPLAGGTIITANYDDAAGDVYVEWASDTGDTKDIAIVVVYAEERDAVMVGIATRGDAEIEGKLPTGITGRIDCYLAFAHAPDKTQPADHGSNSDTAYKSIAIVRKQPEKQK